MAVFNLKRSKGSDNLKHGVTKQVLFTAQTAESADSELADSMADSKADSAESDRSEEFRSTMADSA